MTANKNGSEAHPSLTIQVLAKLKDPRFWAIVAPTLILDGLVVTYINATIASILTLAISLAASYLIRQIDQFAMPQSTAFAATFYEKTVVPAFIGIVFISGADVFARICFMPWYWFHGDKVPSCSFILSASVFDWLGFVLSCIVAATLMESRANFAIMFGIAFYIPLSIADVFTGNLAEKSAALIASSCKWAMDDPSTLDLGAYKYGMAIGIVTRALVAILVAKLILGWREVRRGSSAGDTLTR